MQHILSYWQRFYVESCHCVCIHIIHSIHDYSYRLFGKDRKGSPSRVCWAWTVWKAQGEFPELTDHLELVDYVDVDVDASYACLPVCRRPVHAWVGSIGDWHIRLPYLAGGGTRCSVLSPSKSELQPTDCRNQLATQREWIHCSCAVSLPPSWAPTLLYEDDNKACLSRVW
jgi:hypothetical protein